MNATVKLLADRTFDPFFPGPRLPFDQAAATDAQVGSSDAPDPLDLYARQGRERGYAHAIGDVLATLVLCTEQFIQENTREPASPEEVARLRKLLRDFDDFASSRIRSLGSHGYQSGRGNEHDDPACFI